MAFRRVFTLLVAVFLTCAGPVAAAESVSLRAAQKDGYARVVIAWGKNVSYKPTASEPGRLVLEFAGNASPAAPGDLPANVKGVEILSREPLKVALRFDPAAKTRHFQLGDRTIVDIYDAPVQPPSKEKVAEKPAEKPAEKVAAKEPEKKPEPAPEKTPEKAPAKSEDKKPDAAAASASAPPAAPAPATPAAPAPGPAPGALQSAMQDALKPLAEKTEPVKSNLVTLSSMEAAGMAVFQRAGGIWMLSDRSEMLLTPQISGPRANEILPVTKASSPAGQAFRVNVLADAKQIRAIGGGLLWRVLMPAPPAKAPPVLPEQRSDPKMGMALVWPMRYSNKLVDFPDPVTGRTLKIVTVSSSKYYSGPALKFIEFETLPSYAGLAILPKVDDLQVVLTPAGEVIVTRPGGLNLTPEKIVQAAAAPKDDHTVPSNVRRVFDFKNWQLGGEESLDQNRNIIMSGLHEVDPGSARTEGLLTLARMYLANGMWSEAQGFLTMALNEVPDLNDNPFFSALRGAADALGGRSEEAFDRLSDPELTGFPEVGLWRAFALADLGDWQQAESVMPAEYKILREYPPVLRTQLALVLAEVALRAGDVHTGDDFLDMAESTTDSHAPTRQAALDYLKGESARQKKKTDETKKLWKPLAAGHDELYRAKAGLALTRLMVESKELEPKKAIDNLERIRYTWRGDELEAQIDYWLGKTYFENAEYVKGLNIMREAAAVAPGTRIAERIASDMTRVFGELFSGSELDKVSPLDAAALHEQFAELVPPGEKGDKVVERLAERLVAAGFLDKAQRLLQYQVDHRLAGSEGYRVAVRLGAIYLLGGKPDKALAALNKASTLYAALPEEMKSEQRTLEMGLLRGRGLMDKGRPDQALATLKGLSANPTVNNLRADIAWRAGYWDDAGEALEDVIMDRGFSLTRPLESENVALILQRAVALNLAGDRVGLAHMREEYSDVMTQTDKARIFEVVTRPRQSGVLADRETLMSAVSEVDLFKDFLESYRKSHAAP